MDSRFGPERVCEPVAAPFVERALVAARLCGVTRLADITGLDRLGLPVWQAVRPAGRSLSVHQGKGASPAAARIGALCEAIEAHCAEQVSGDGPLCAFADLPQNARAPDIADYCANRDARPDDGVSLQWCSATDLLSGARQYLPQDLVSLDYTRGLPTLLERASSGLGAGAGEGGALQISLLEVIERDAVGEWRRMDREARMATSIQLDTIPLDWFKAWRDRFRSLGIALRAYRIASITGVPVFMCVIGGVEEFGPAYRRFNGTSAHGDPEIALFKALAEAIQSRLTLIAGVRDDILPSHYATRQSKPAAADDPPAGCQAWDRIEPADDRPEPLAERLAAMGYRQVIVKRLDGALDGVAVTKVFVPGLASDSRTRRPTR